MVVTLTFDKVNEIITVDISEIEATIQDLHNAIKDWEDNLQNCEIAKICDSYGKQQLVGGIYVGLTMVLYDWKLAFAARGGPDWVECVISGGNLVRYDTVAEGYTSPIEPTAYVSVTISSSSSATLQELTDIQYSSFENGVSIDVVSGISGTDYPTGTRRQPVDNLVDAKSIATTRGLSVLYITGNITIGAMDNVDGYIMIGQNPELTTMTFTNGCSTVATEIKDCMLDGTLSGDVQIRGCFIGALSGLQGTILNCSLTDTITLGGTSSDLAQFIECYLGTTAVGVITVDMNGDGPTLAMRAYTGGVEVKNKTGNSKVAIDFLSGRLIIDSTVTNGTFFVRGVGEISENSGTGITLHDDPLTNPASVSDWSWDETLADHLTAGSTGAKLNEGATSVPKSKGEYEEDQLNP